MLAAMPATNKESSVLLAALTVRLLAVTALGVVYGEP